MFNPYYRISLQQCLEHPLFKPVRNEEKEAIVGQPVTLEFERMVLDRNCLRQLILAECQHYVDLKNAEKATAGEAKSTSATTESAQP